MPGAQRNGGSGLLEKTARMPWWGGIVLAFLAFIMLHPFAIMHVAAAGPVGDAAPFTSKAFWKGVAGTVEFVVPAVLLFAPLLAALVTRVLRRTGE